MLDEEEEKEVKADGVSGCATGEDPLDPAEVSLKNEESTEEEEAEEEEEKATTEVSRKIDDEENVEMDEQGLEFKLCC